MIGDKYLFECDVCSEQLVAVQRDKGTLPMMLKECQNPTCGWFMARDTGKVKAVGKTPTHELVTDPENKTDKLKLKLMEANTDATSKN